MKVYLVMHTIPYEHAQTMYICKTLEGAQKKMDKIAKIELYEKVEPHDKKDTYYINQHKCMFYIEEQELFE